MKIHEYQGQATLRASTACPCPRAIPRSRSRRRRAIAERLIAETGNEVVVVKAQIHAGGRGKGGGVKVVKGGAAEAAAVAEKILGMQLVTQQTGPEGKKVRRLLRRAGPRHRARALPRARSSIATAAASP